MDIQKISLVQTSFALLGDRTDEAAALFYQRLFELEPGLRPLFHNDLHQQGAKFMAILAFIVTSLKKPEAMIPAIKQLGQRHVIYGVRPEHYRLVNAALSWSLKQMLSDSFTPEVAEAWDDVYYLIAGLMKEAASQVTFQQAFDQGALQDPQT